MKFLVIGLGSMGKRRINLLLKYFDDVTVCGVDISEERRFQAQELFNINTYADLNTAISKGKTICRFGLCFACLPRRYHIEMYKKQAACFLRNKSASK